MMPRVNTMILRFQRAAALLAAAAGFGILYFAASAFTGDYAVAGLSDDAVRCVAHFSVYGTLAALIARAVGGWHLLAWLLAALLATGEEIHQLFVQYRFACVADWAINMAGITTFLVASHQWTVLRRWGDRWVWSSIHRAAAWPRSALRTLP